MTKHVEGTFQRVPRRRTPRFEANSTHAGRDRPDGRKCECQMPSREREERKMGWREKWKKTWWRQTGEFWLFVYRTQHQTRQTYARYGSWLRTATIGALIGASGYSAPILQRVLETELGTVEASRRIQSFVLTTGGALVGAAAIVTSLVLFAMQVNVERMPHGLFRQLSDDRKVLGAFAGTFVLAIGIAASSTVTEQDNVAVVLIGSTWAFLTILWLFRYAYRRALQMINPGHQLKMLLEETTKDLRGWGRKADRVGRMLEDGQSGEADASGKETSPDVTRTGFFQAYPRWATAATRNVQHAMAIARRYTEQDDYEVAGAALSAVVCINAAYIAAKGRTFYSNVLFLEHPGSHDDFITDSLEHMRQNADRAIVRRDERQIEQTMQALTGLVQVYLRIGYASRNAEKTHAFLAAGYLAQAVRAVIPHDMADVLMEGQRLLGQAACSFVRAGSVLDGAGLGEKIAAVRLRGMRHRELPPRDERRAETAHGPDTRAAAVKEPQRRLRARQSPPARFRGCKTVPPSARYPTGERARHGPGTVLLVERHAGAAGAAHRMGKRHRSDGARQRRRARAVAKRGTVGRRRAPHGKGIAAPGH